MRRREYLTLIGTTGTVALAGCTGEEEPATYQNSSGTTSKMTTTASTGGTGTNTQTSTETTTETETETETETSQGTASAEVIHSEFFTAETEYDTMYGVLGGIENTGSARLGWVEGTVKFYDDEDNLLDSNTVLMEDLDSGEIWEFVTQYYGSDEPASGKVELKSADRFTSSAADWAKLESHSIEMPSDGYSSPKVVGRATNTTDVTKGYLEARAKVYSKEGTVIAGGYTNITDLGAGETWKFEVDAMMPEDWYERIDHAKVALVK
ncbi:FxLYD domain-containing protein [Haloarchaeobius sp. DFWS5]|uniref:FxLYD domain-containing protein n=1 Tax=Haloarchaeobius sp. DFWS5 TaxID=3446114 RepID=UPI003EB8ABDC